MRKYIQIFAGIAVLLSALSGAAEVSYEVRVTVPFAFDAGGKLCPAGDYRLTVDRGLGQVAFSTDRTRLAVLITTKGESPRDYRNFVRFVRYGQKWFVQDIVSNGESQHIAPGKAQREAMLQASAPKPTVAELATR
ncbi:MAG TPA: hypothetical protein VFA85_08625 [Terriglobales bacterium]|nr:hypothetical protein [Terriglobales bacterium]